MTNRMTAADHIRELTHGFTTAAYGPNWAPTPTTNPPPYNRPNRNGWVLLPGQRIHTVRNAALLDQLQNTATTTSHAGDAFHATPSSKPAGRLDVLAFLHRLDHQSRHLATDHHIPDLPLRQRLNQLAGALPHEPHRTVTTWWATARVLTQHDGPPYSPPVPCPVETCERHSSIRVRVEERLAVCVECHTIWSDDNEADRSFGRLAMWVKWAADHLAGLRHVVPATLENSGYADHLDYHIECPECAPERLAMAQREALRLMQIRRSRADERLAS